MLGGSGAKNSNVDSQAFETDEGFCFRSVAVSSHTKNSHVFNKCYQLNMNNDLSGVYGAGSFRRCATIAEIRFHIKGWLIGHYRAFEPVVVEKIFTIRSFFR